MICYNCVQIVFFSNLYSSEESLPSALTVVIYIELYYWCLNTRRKIKQPTTPQTKQSENEVTAVHLLLFLSESIYSQEMWGLHCHTEQTQQRCL